jgi:hypothetical protein
MRASLEINYKNNHKIMVIFILSIKSFDKRERVWYSCLVLLISTAMYTYSLSTQMPRALAISFDKAGNPDIVTLAKSNDTTKLPVNFPIDIFINKYKEWKASFASTAGKDETNHLYAILRDMHQAAGINKGNTVWNADAEMDAFAAYVMAVKTARTTVATAATAAKPVAIPAISIDSTVPAPVSTASSVPMVTPTTTDIPTSSAPASTVPALVVAERDTKVVAKEKVEVAIKWVKIPDWYKLSIDKDNKVWLVGDTGRRYFTIGNPENKDKETKDGLQKWVNTMKTQIEGGWSAGVVTLPKDIEKSKKYPNTVIKSGTEEKDYTKGESYVESSDEENIFPAYGYKWKTDGEKDFSVEKIKETVSKVAYKVGGTNPPPGLSVTRVVEVGADDDKETRVYFSKALKSVGEYGTGEARSVIALDDGDIDEDFDTVSIDGVIYTVEITGQTIEFTRDSAATEKIKKENADTQKFLTEVKNTVVTVDGLPGVTSIRGLTLDKDGEVRLPISHKDIDGTDYKDIGLGTQETWKDDGGWDDAIVVGSVAYDVSMAWTNNKPSLKFTKNVEKTKEYKDAQDSKLIERNTEFVKKNNKALTDCATWDICTDTQKPLVAAAIAANAPLSAVKAIQKEMKQKETGIWDTALLNVLMHQKK